jgi:4-diphosphocytidyl-2-C-methyl-D-erythritol kinase
LARTEEAVVAVCRAKLNLVLEVLSRRPDGYHNIATVMHPIELADTLTARPGRPGVRLQTQGLPSPEGADNLVVKATEAFYAAAGGKAAVEMVLEKRIPAESGLGGGSADAAGALACLAALHGESLTDDGLLTVARTVGADVPFFLGSGAALVEGIGDRLRALPTCHFWVVLALGRPGVSTRWAYQQIGPQHYTDGARTERAAAALAQGGPIGELWNGFAAALAPSRPDLVELVDRVSQLAGSPAALTGSGSCVYAMAPSSRVADAARDALANEGYWTWSGPSASEPITVTRTRQGGTPGGVSH